MTQSAYFKGVKALPDYCLAVEMTTGTSIFFDFTSRLKTARFHALQDQKLFQSVWTDGNYLIFNAAGQEKLKITAAEFMDLVLVDRTC